MRAIARILLVLVSAGIYLAVAIAGFGGVVAFFSDAAMIALTGVFVVLCVVAYFAGGNVSPGVREDRSNRWVIWLLLVVALVDAYVPAWCDRNGFWTIDGLYGVIRHPSYLGLLITVLGWGLPFRSWIGVLIGLLFAPIIVARIISEERLLQSQFVAPYDVYRARTWRLIPRVY